MRKMNATKVEEHGFTQILFMWNPNTLHVSTVYAAWNVWVSKPDVLNFNSTMAFLIFFKLVCGTQVWVLKACYWCGSYDLYSYRPEFAAISAMDLFLNMIPLWMWTVIGIPPTKSSANIYKAKCFKLFVDSHLI